MVVYLEKKMTKKKMTKVKTEKKKFKDFKSAFEYMLTRSPKEILNTKTDPFIEKFFKDIYKDIDI